ncbi:T9SS type A sorting domain-containing protein, partial [candidate division KSB1 bacterium]|nr:T9SS type A sorting domain-containing protein [candidate division KSB1 bacterium]
PDIIDRKDNPYQKLFELAAHVGQAAQNKKIWMLIKGEKTRGETYASVSPELPIAILRDPPGDGSYAYLEKDSTISCSFSNYYRETDESGEFGDHKIGAVMEVGVTFWSVSISSEVGGYVMIMDDVVEGTENLKDDELITTLKMTERFQTSDDIKVIGPKGDIFIGASFNMLYGISDVVDYNPLTYRVELDTSISWRPDGFNTTYIYTEHHIRNYEIPKLINARNLTDDPAQKAKCEASIFTWNSLLAENERLKEKAVHKENITFSADHAASYESTVTVDTSFSIEYMQYFDESSALGLGVVIGSVPQEWGSTSRMGWCRGTVKGTNIINTTTVGYVFNDDDTGDDFTVNIKEDRAFGTPVFELVAGQSSCPWEPGTLARDGVDIGIDTHLIEDVPLGEPAVFELYCGNTSQTNEERIYEIKLIAASNPDGAEVTIGGNPTTDPIVLENIGPNNSIKQTLRVRREPPAFDFNNLQVMMYPACQYELFTQNMPIGIADTVTFSVHFANTGSPVTLSVPKENWVIDQNDTYLEYAITDYNTAVADSIKLQVRRQGGSWRTAKSYAANAVSNSIKAALDVTNTASFPDGRYELRAAAESAEGVNYSGAAAGIIDRNSLVVTGTEPADNVLHSGDRICVHFSDVLVEAMLNGADNVSLKTVEDSVDIEIKVTCADCTLIIEPVENLTVYANKNLTARVCGLKSGNGCIQHKTACWSFKVDENYTKIDRETLAAVPEHFYLNQNYPNPFNPATVIEYGVPVAEHVRLSVYNILGQEIKVLVDRRHQPGNYSAVFSVTDGGLAGGVYLYKLEAGRFRQTRKLLVLK